MIEKAYWLFEILAVLICLSSINGKKFKINIYSASFIAIEVLLMQMMQDEIVSRKIYFVVYLLYGMYAYLEFNDTVKKTIAKCIICTIVVGTVQLLLYLPASLIYSLIQSESIVIFIINPELFMIIRPAVAYAA